MFIICAQRSPLIDFTLSTVCSLIGSFVYVWCSPLFLPLIFCSIRRVHSSCFIVSIEISIRAHVNVRKGRNENVCMNECDMCKYSVLPPFFYVFECVLYIKYTPHVCIQSASIIYMSLDKDD